MERLMKAISFFDKFHQIDVTDPVSLLEDVIRCNDVTGITVFDVFQRPVFPILGFFACGNCISDLNISVVCLRVSQNEIALKFSE